jgi:nitric oxide reductase NorD protein
MTAALEQLGDQYAIYGFSSRGREHVEVYPVKAFRDPLDQHARARIGGIEPKSGTRMGAALRHMIPKFAAISARSKHLILLSDGFPQDHDYGAERRTHTYGIERPRRRTARAQHSQNAAVLRHRRSLRQRLSAPHVRPGAIFDHR